MHTDKIHAKNYKLSNSLTTVIMMDLQHPPNDAAIFTVNRHSPSFHLRTCQNFLSFQVIRPTVWT